MEEGATGHKLTEHSCVHRISPRLGKKGGRRRERKKGGREKIRRVYPRLALWKAQEQREHVVFGARIFSSFAENCVLFRST